MIPLDQCAYVLGEQYERQPSTTFSVAEVIAKGIADNKF